jgi:hypothetical protein
VGLLLQYLLSLAAAPVAIPADSKPKAKDSGKAVIKEKSKARASGKS